MLIDYQLLLIVIILSWLKKGKIVAEGTHENLMRKYLKYQKLYKANLLKNTE